MEDNIYHVDRKRVSKIEDDGIFRRYSNVQLKDVPSDNVRYLLKLFFTKASINMGKDTCDIPEQSIDAIMEFITKDFKYIPMLYIGSAIIRGSLGKYDVKGRLVPRTIYLWLNEASNEYNRTLEREKYKNYNETKNITFDLHKYPVGSAIIKKIDWIKNGTITMDDWDRIPLKELAERIGMGMMPVPELWGVTSKNKK